MYPINNLKFTLPVEILISWFNREVHAVFVLSFYDLLLNNFNEINNVHNLY